MIFAEDTFFSMQREFLEITKEATSQFVATQPKVNPINIRMDTRSPIGPFKPGTNPVPNTLRNYMGALKQKTTDPTVGGLAQTQLDSLNYITKRNPSLRSSIRVDNRMTSPGNAHIKILPKSGTTTVASQNVNPLTLSHEVGHADDFASRKGFNIKNPDREAPTRQITNRIETVERSVNRAQDKAKQGETYVDSLRRKIGPTYLGRKMGVDYKVLPYGTRQEPSGSTDLMFKKLRKMQRVGGKRDRVVDEVQANRRTLESYAPWRNRKKVPMTPEQRRMAAEVLANQTTYYETNPVFRNFHSGGDSLTFATGESKRSRGLKRQIGSTPAKDKLLRIKQMKRDTNKRVSRLQSLISRADEVGAVTVAGKLRRRLENLTNGKLRRLNALQEEVIKNQNPFRGARLRDSGSWERMSNSQRRSYIQQILKNEKRLASDFGQDAGKLYKSEMMRALRKTLRR